MKKAFITLIGSALLFVGSVSVSTTKPVSGTDVTVDREEVSLQTFEQVAGSIPEPTNTSNVVEPVTVEETPEPSVFKSTTDYILGIENPNEAMAIYQAYLKNKEHFEADVDGAIADFYSLVEQHPNLQLYQIANIYKYAI